MIKLINAIIKIVPNRYTNISDINNAISYIYRTQRKHSLPIFCYGAYPPTADNIIAQFKETIDNYSAAPDTYLVHFIISFPTVTLNNNTLLLFADMIARLFCKEYQICYSFHQDTDNLHFHYIVSAVSYMPETPYIDNNKINIYLSQMSELAKNFGIMLKRKE